MISGLAGAVQRGDKRFPRVIADEFERPDSPNLWRTPTGYVLWKQWSGTWEVLSNRLYIPTSFVRPVVVVNARTPDVDVSLGVTSNGGDALLLRVSDPENYIRVFNELKRVAVEVPIVRDVWEVAFGPPAPENETEYEWIFEYGAATSGSGNHSHPDADSYAENTSEQVYRWGASPTVPPTHPPLVGHSHTVFQDGDGAEPTGFAIHDHGMSEAWYTGRTRNPSNTGSHAGHTRRGLFTSGTSEDNVQIWFNDRWGAGLGARVDAFGNTNLHRHTDYRDREAHVHPMSGDPYFIYQLSSTTTVWEFERNTVVERVVNGVAEEMFRDSDIVASPTEFRAVCSGSSITIYVDGIATPLTSLTETFNESAAHFGAGRLNSAGVSQTTNIDNFTLEWLNP